MYVRFFFFSSRRRHTRWPRDWSSDVCSSDLDPGQPAAGHAQLVVASGAASARSPSWYHDIAAHPDQVWVGVAGHQIRVTAEQLNGERREEAWQRIIASQPRYASYRRKTDRLLPSPTVPCPR